MRARRPSKKWPLRSARSLMRCLPSRRCDGFGCMAFLLLLVVSVRGSAVEAQRLAPSPPPSFAPSLAPSRTPSLAAPAAASAPLLAASSRALPGSSLEAPPAPVAHAEHAELAATSAAPTPRPLPRPPRVRILPPPLRRAPDFEHPGKGAELVRQHRLPLRTFSRYIVDSENMRVKWACVNWGGAYLPTHVVGGLEVQPLDNLTRRISELGFNCVRLAYSTQGYVTNPLIDRANLAANPDMQGLRFRDAFDRVVESLTNEGLMVIINNHVSKSGWCCNVAQDEGLWYVPGYNESCWINSLVGLAQKYKANPLVVAFDLRNEPHDTPVGPLTWGDGNRKSDWAMAAERAGNEVLQASPDVLIVVSAICFCMDLRPMKRHQINLMYPNRVVYEVHNYIEFQVMSVISNNLMSWIDCERFAAGFAALCAVGMCLLRRSWGRLCAPLPPHGVLRMTVGFWLALTSALFAGAFFYMFKGYLVYCSYYAWNWAMPLLILSTLISLGFFLLTAWGYVAYLRRPANRSELEDCLVPFDGEMAAFDALEGELSRLQVELAAVVGPRREDTDGARRSFFARPTSPSTASASQRAHAASLAAEMGTRVSRAYSRDDDEGGPVTVVETLRTEPRWRRAARIDAGWRSLDTALRLACDSDEATPRSLYMGGHNHEQGWDYGLCCGLQCCCCLAVLCLLFVMLAVAATLGDSYMYLQSSFDYKWGFALQEGYEYTAPVWLGEFGQHTRGRYWKHLLSYMSKRDVDFAYWTFNGLKLSEGEYDTMGLWHPYDKPAWESESFGLLSEDYYSIRHPWKLLDLRTLMSSPSGWIADDYPCDRAVLGNACGG